MVLWVHPALLLLLCCTGVTSIIHRCVRTGQVQVVLQLACWPQYAQRVILQLLQQTILIYTRCEGHATMTSQLCESYPESQYCMLCHNRTPD